MNAVDHVNVILRDPHVVLLPSDPSDAMSRGTWNFEQHWNATSKRISEKFILHRVDEGGSRRFVFEHSALGSLRITVDGRTLHSDLTPDARLPDRSPRLLPGRSDMPDSYDALPERSAETFLCDETR